MAAKVKAKKAKKNPKMVKAAKLRAETRRKNLARQERIAAERKKVTPSKVMAQINELPEGPIKQTALAWYQGRKGRISPKDVPVQDMLTIAEMNKAGLPHRIVEVIAHLKPRQGMNAYGLYVKALKLASEKKVEDALPAMFTPTIVNTPIELKEEEKLVVTTESAVATPETVAEAKQEFVPEIPAQMETPKVEEVPVATQEVVPAVEVKQEEVAQEATAS